MIDNDLSGAVPPWTSPYEAARIREESDVRYSYGVLRAEWQREQDRKRKAKRDPFIVVACFIVMLGALFCVWLKGTGVL